tara:strand:+ start:14 stop:358 length:345 start_codon:yes stop_codon:yes gene_type:complete
MILDITRGSDYELRLNIQNPDGSPKDLSGTMELKFAISKYITSPVPDLIFDLNDPELSITDAPNGSIKIDIKSSTLANLEADRVYFTELWQKNALGQSLTLQSQNILVNDAIIN